MSNAFDYLEKIEEREEKIFELQSCIRTLMETLKYRAGSTGKHEDYITREGVFKYMWMNIKLGKFHRDYIYEKFPGLWELHACIKEF